MLKFLLFFIENSIFSHFQPKLIEISQKNANIKNLIFSIFPRSRDFAGFVMRK
jgi:hypothetical protein